MRYGFIGLGNLGGHLAASLLGNGFELAVCDTNKAVAGRHKAMGAYLADMPEELAALCDAVITCLPSPAASETVLSSILKVARPGMTWIEMSTLGRDNILRLAAMASEKGVRTMEAPVTGGVHLAANGRITVLAGGDVDLFEQHEPALKAMGDKIFPASGEALMLAKRAGLDLGKAWEAIATSSGTSFVHETEGQLILNGSYDIAFTMDLALKDLGFAMDFGREFGVPLDLASLVQQRFIEGKQTYGGSAQSTQIVKLLEDLLETDLRAPGFPATLD
jgi:3-hydroxyisobutyrate dehydrogenase